MDHFGENYMGVGRARIYHLKWVEKNHVSLCKFLYHFFVRFYDLLIRSCLFLIVPEMLKISLYMLFWEPFHLYDYFVIKSSAVWNIHIRGQHPNWDSTNAFIMFFLYFRPIKFLACFFAHKINVFKFQFTMFMPSSIFFDWI